MAFSAQPLRLRLGEMVTAPSLLTIGTLPDLVTTMARDIVTLDTAVDITPLEIPSAILAFITTHFT